MAKGTLYLIPNVIAEDTTHQAIPEGVKDTLKTIRYFLAEDVRTARRYLSSLKIFGSIEGLTFEVLNKDTTTEEIATLMTPLSEGNDVGVISESGCPAVADPGSLAVAYAHAHDIKVVPMVGPSSILMALMASGLNGQQFAFNGYLPIEKKEVVKTIRQLEDESRKKNQTQVFIETPYRNNKLFETLIKTLQPETQLCVACNIMGVDEAIQTRPVNTWRKEKARWPKAPCIFMFLGK